MIAKLSNAELCETLRDVPHRKWIEIEKDTHMAIGVIAHRAADRIAELEKALRTVSIIDLGFGVPKWFCGGCASYGDGANSIRHKDDCIVVRTLSL